MRRRDMLRMLSGAAAVMLAPALGGCAYTEAEYRVRYRYPSYEYYYYPDVNVYFHVYSGYYYYPHRGSWRRSRVLPGHIHLDRRRRRRIYVPGRRPYDRNRDHRRDYGWPDRDGRRHRDGGRGPRRGDDDGRRDRRDRDGDRQRGGVIGRRRDDDRDRIEREEWRRWPGRRRHD